MNDCHNADGILRV